MRRLISTAAAIVLASTAAQGQENTPLFKEDAIDPRNPAVLHDSKTYVVPYVQVLASTDGDMWSDAGSARMHAKFYNYGIDKATMQDLAKQLHADLVSKLKALGITVLTYDDVKDTDTMKGADRRTPDKDPQYDGMNTTQWRGAGPHYVIATDRDEDNIKPALQGIAWGLRGIAKDKDAIVLVPEYWFGMPVASSEQQTGAFMDQAGVYVVPGMRLIMANAQFINNRGRGGAVQIKWPHKVSDNIGTVSKGEMETASYAGVKRGTQDYAIRIDKERFRAAIMRGGAAFNDVLIDQVKKSMADK